MSNCDFQIGRVVDAIEEMGELDNTLIIYIQGDNGSSAEDPSGRGMTSEIVTLGNGIDDRPQPAPLLRRHFTAEGGIVAARIYATSLGLYELRLNGQRVGEALLTPGWTS